MTMCDRIEPLIDACLDGEVDAAHAAEIDTHLATCAACTGRLREREALVARLRAVQPFEAPDALRTRVASLMDSRVNASEPRVGSREGSADARSRVTRALLWTAALAAAVLVGIAIGSSRWHGEATPGAVADAVVSAHIRSLMAAHLYDVESTDRHTVKPWFAGRLDFSPTVPDLATDGFPLAGGRVDYVASHPAAALVYRHGAHAINVFIWPTTEADRSPRRTDDPRGYHLVDWTQDHLACWVVSDVAAGDLDAFVTRFRATR